QGTLYGASSMGGLVRFVTADPSTAGLFGKVQGDVNSIHNGAEAGYSVRGSVNVPVNDNVAIRVSGFTRRDPGYIDNPILGIDGINKANVAGGRISALLKTSDTFSFKLNALYEHTDRKGLNDVLVEPGLGDLQQDY